MERMNQINVQIFNFYQVVPPQQNPGQNYQPRQILNYKKKKSNNLPQSHRPQPQIAQPSISNSTPLPQFYGQKPYDSGKQDPNYSDIYSFNLLKRGRGIDPNEYYIITHAANDALKAKENPLSKGIIKRIKSALGGEWMVFSSKKGLKGYDFSLSIVTDNDFLAFTIANFHFHVCRLRA